MLKAKTLEHVLSSEQMTLLQGEYTLRHKQALMEFAETLEKEYKPYK